MTLTVASWQLLMDRLVADYIPGAGQAPGSGTEGDDPLGLRYADLGPLAFVLNEALDSAVNRGADRDSIIEQVAQAAGDEFGLDEVEAVLSDENRDPDPTLLQAFANVFNIDMGIIVDAAQRGGAKKLGPATYPPGY